MLLFGGIGSIRITISISICFTIFSVVRLDELGPLVAVGLGGVKLKKSLLVRMLFAAGMLIIIWWLHFSRGIAFVAIFLL